MGKTYGSRYGMRKKHSEMLEDKTLKKCDGLFSAKHSRHPNKRNVSKGLAKEYLTSRVSEGNWDRRTGNCYERTDRMYGHMKTSRGTRRARLKRNTNELINEIDKI